MNTNTRVGTITNTVRSTRSCEFTNCGTVLAFLSTTATRAGPQRQTKLVMLLLSVQLQ